jgi:hypothetical protein
MRETGQLERHLDTDHTADQEFACTIAVLPSIRHSLSLVAYQPPAATNPPDPSAPFLDDSPSRVLLLSCTARAWLVVG